MKKIFLAVFAVLLVVSFGTLTAFAQPQFMGQTGAKGYCPYYGQSANNLTDEQKNQIADWHKQRLEQRKEMLAKQVEWGWITQEQADQQILWMEQRMANGVTGPGMMMGQGAHGRGCGGWSGNW